MRTTWVIGAAFLLAFVVAPGLAAGAEGIGKEELDKLAKEVEASAELWFEGKPETAELDQKLKGVTYDAESVPPLQAQLLLRRKDPIDLYVANKLLRPMLMAKPEVIKLILPAVMPIQARATVRPFQKFDPAKVQRRKMPDYGKQVPSEKVFADLIEMEKGRYVKSTQDSLTAGHNTQATMLAVTTAKLLIYASTPEYDGRVVRLLGTQEKSGSTSFLEMLEALRNESDKMDEKRAAEFYDDLRRLAYSLNKTVRSYTDYTKPVIKDEADSHYPQAPHAKDLCPAILVTEAANVFAPKANLPALKVPTRQDILANALLAQAEPLRRSHKKEDIDQAKAKLNEIIKNYPNTSAAKEAQNQLRLLKRMN